MRWVMYRLGIFSVAFLAGTWIAGTVNPSVKATGDVMEVAELSPSTGTSLVVTCDDGNPSVEEVRGNDGALQVKCVKSQMHIIRSRPLLRQSHPLLARPTAPFASLMKPASIWSE